MEDAQGFAAVPPPRDDRRDRQVLLRFVGAVQQQQLQATDAVVAAAAGSVCGYCVISASLNRLSLGMQASFGTQAGALMRKNAAFQRRNRKSNCCITVTPILFIMLLFVIQKLVNSAFNTPDTRVSSALRYCLCCLTL